MLAQPIKSTVPLSDRCVGEFNVWRRHVRYEFVDRHRRHRYLGRGDHGSSGHLTVMTRGAERLTYEIRVRGELTDALVAALKALNLRIEETGNGTILVGVFRDQSELHGALQAMQDFGVELVEIRQR
jgi:hypothetical protein